MIVQDYWEGSWRPLSVNDASLQSSTSFVESESYWLARTDISNSLQEFQGAEGAEPTGDLERVQAGGLDPKGTNRRDAGRIRPWSATYKSHLRLISRICDL